MTDNSFETTVTSLVKGMDSFLTSKTVVGDPIQIGETIILPLVDVSFGIGAGSFTGETVVAVSAEKYLRLPY